MKQEMMWYQLDYMQIICTLALVQTDNTLVPQCLMVSWHPNNGVRVLKAVRFLIMFHLILHAVIIIA